MFVDLETDFDWEGFERNGLSSGYHDATVYDGCDGRGSPCRKRWDLGRLARIQECVFESSDSM